MIRPACIGHSFPLEGTGIMTEVSQEFEIENGSHQCHSIGIVQFF